MSNELKRVLVVDDDEVARNLIANYLRKLGVEKVDMLEDGDDAWSSLQEFTYECIVLDWKLPGLSGMALFNRIRRLRQYRTTPMLVVSGFLEKDDFRLLQEYPCTALMEKPFTKVLFENKLAELVREKEWYGQNVALVDTLLDAVQRDAGKTESLLKQLLKKAPNPIPLAVLVARRLIDAEMFASAEKVLRGVLKVDADCIVAMNELGKVLHHMGRYKQSLEMLRNATKLSPQNLARLCLLGEVELNLRDPESAKAYFDKVLEADGDDDVAKSGNIVARNMEEAMEAPTAAHVAQSFASIMNTMGIAYVRGGDFKRGIEQYKAAMPFLHESNDSARVAFNLGLGFLRWGKPEAALPWFQKSEQLATDGFAKSAGYVAKLMQSKGLGDQIDSAALAGQLDDVRFERVVGHGPASSVAPPSPASSTKSSKGNVIPFPAAIKKPAKEDDLQEETVASGSGEMSVRKSDSNHAAKIAKAFDEETDPEVMHDPTLEDEVINV